MSEEAIVPEIVNEDKELEKRVAKVLVNLEKKDYRATIVHRSEQGQVPDAMTAFINVSDDDNSKNRHGYNRELDIKGTIGEYQQWFNQSVRFTTALSNLIDWQYMEVPDPEHEGKTMLVEVDLMQLDAEEGRWLSLALHGTQSEKEIRLMRAGFGLQEENFGDKAGKWFGLVRRKKSEVYDQVNKQ